MYGASGECFDTLFTPDGRRFVGLIRFVSFVRFLPFPLQLERLQHFFHIGIDLFFMIRFDRTYQSEYVSRMDDNPLPPDDARLRGGRREAPRDRLEAIGDNPGGRLRP